MIQAECARLIAVRFALFCEAWVWTTQIRPYSLFTALCLLVLFLQKYLVKRKQKTKERCESYFAKPSISI